MSLDRRPPCGHSRQQGIALLTALLVVALATTLAVALTKSQQLQVRRTGNHLHRDQAMQLALGGEHWAKVVLTEDKKESQIDSLDEDWALVLPPTPTDPGEIWGQILDLQGRFNVNNLVGPEQALWRQRYQRLLVHLELEPGLMQPLVDWIDADIEPLLPEGAEDDYYSGLEPPYRTANSPMLSLSELRLVKGYEQEQFNKIAPFLTALPAPTTLNVNTAPAEVLMSLANDLTLSDMQELVANRDETPFENVAAFTSDSALRGQTVAADGLSVASEWFLVQANASLVNTTIHLRIVLNRTANGITTYQRTHGQF